MVKLKDKKNGPESKDNLLSLHAKSKTIKKKKVDNMTKKDVKNITNTNRNKTDKADEEVGYSGAVKKRSVNAFNGFQVDEKYGNIQDAFSILWVRYKPRSTPHIKSTSDWTTEMLHEPEHGEATPLITRKKLKELAQRMYQDDIQAHKTFLSGYGSKPFHKLILNHGTSRDKIAELSFQCVESPVYSLSAMFSLIDFIDAIFKDRCLETIDNVMNIFQTTLLAHNFIAKEFECHNFSILVPLLKSNLEKVERQMILWYFEDQVRLCYRKLIYNLDKICHDSRKSVKTLGVKSLNQLLRKHPNQEPELVIQKLVNKLGDTNKEVAGNVLRSLTTLQLNRSHRIILVSAIEELLYRPNVSSRTQYFCLCCFKDMIFQKSDDVLPERLIKLYFNFFRIRSQMGDVDSHFMGALLRGINRAYPYLSGKRLSFIDDQVATIYKLCHMVSFSVGTQALQLIYQVQGSIDSEMSDRFYCVLYRKLLDPAFTNSSSSGAFLNIIFKSLVKDTNVNRVRAFFMRLLQLSKYHSAHIAVSILFMISEVIKDNPRLEGVTMLFTSENYPLQFELNLDDDNDKSDYKYPDLDEVNNQQEKIETESSWHHRKNWKPFRHGLCPNSYDPEARNPAFAHANLAPIWEIQELEHYYHPTVRLFASQLLNQMHIEYSGDPLQDFTLTRFLDRFSHRNPKKIDHLKGKSAAVFGSRTGYISKGSRNIPVQSDQFKALKDSEVAVEDVFLHNFLTRYQKTVVPQKTEELGAKYDDSDDEFDDYLSEMNSNLRGTEDKDAEEGHLDFARSAVVVQSAEDEDDDDANYENDSEESGDSDIEVDASVGGSEDEVDKDIEKDDTCDKDEDEYADEDSILDDYDDEEEEDRPDEDIHYNSKNSKRPSSRDWRSMLVDADELTQLLESNASNCPLAGTSEELSNKDNSGMKQLKWEQKRMHNSFSDRSQMKSKSKRNYKGNKNYFPKRRKLK